MSRRCHDPLAEGHRPHWLTIADMHRNVISRDAVPAGSDLRIVMRDALVNQAAGGWQAESDGRYGFAFVNRAGERRLVSLAAAEPGTAIGAGYAGLASCHSVA